MFFRMSTFTKNLLKTLPILIIRHLQLKNKRFLQKSSEQCRVFKKINHLIDFYLCFLVFYIMWLIKYVADGLFKSCGCCGGNNDV